MRDLDLQNGRRIHQVLRWSLCLVVLMTAAGFALSYPWRVLPAVLGAIAAPIAFVSMSVVVWRARHRKSPRPGVRRWIEESYGSDSWLRFNQNLAALTLILMGFMTGLFALTFNLLHAFSVK